MSIERKPPDKPVDPVGCTTTIQGGIAGVVVGLIFFSAVGSARIEEAFGLIFVPFFIAGLASGLIIGLLRENRQQRLQAESHEPSKPKRQFRLATLVVGSLTIGICMPLVLFFLHDFTDRSGFGLALALGISALLCFFTTLVTEVICAWRDGDEWN